MATNLVEKYIDEKSQYLFNKHFYKLILEKKYIENFGEIEIARMKNIYDAMVINKKLEEIFFTGGSDSIQEDILADYKARKEFFDLERQIQELEENVKTNSKKLKNLELYYNKDIKSKFELIVKKASPYVNSSKKAKAIWEKFTEAIATQNWKRIFRLALDANELRIYKAKFTEEELQETIKEIQDARTTVRHRHPFNIEETLIDEETLKIRKDEEKNNLKTMKESYSKIADIYLSTTNEPRWFS